MQFGLSAQLFLSYWCAGILAASVAVVLASWRLQPLALIAGAGLVGGLMGLVLTFNIQRGLQRVERVLVRLAQGQEAGEELTAGWLWPLSPLFARVRLLARAIEEQARRETLTAEQRDQLLQTVSEAAVQEERNRLARDLHDSIKQEIFGIGMSAAAIEERLTGGLAVVQMPLADIQQSVQAVQSEMDALLQQLRPATLSITGIVESLRTQCQALAYRINGQASIEVGELPPTERLAPAMAEGLQRIVQEALSNIARHARAHCVKLWIGQRNEALVVEIEDDGQGFALQEAVNGMGLANMRTRAQALGGSVEVQSKPGETSVSIYLPLLDVRSKQLTTQQQVVKDQARRAQRWHKGVDLLLPLTGLGLLLGLPFVLVGVGLLLAWLGLGLAYAERKRLARLTNGTGKETLALQVKEYEAAVSLLILFGICVWYLPAGLSGGASEPLIALATGVSLAVVGLALVVGWKYRGGIAAYGRELLPGERAAEGKLRLLQMQVSLGIWVGVVILTLVIGQLGLGFPPRTADQWSSDAIVALLSSWPVLELASYIQSRRWLRLAATS